MAAWWDLYPCLLVPAVPCKRGPMLEESVLEDNFYRDPLRSLSSPSGVSAIGAQGWSIRAGSMRVAEAQTEAQLAGSFGGEKTLNRWRIIEIAWMKAFFARLKEVKLLDDPQVAALADGTQGISDLNNVINAVSAGAAIGAAGGTVVPGVGNVIGGLVGAAGGLLVGLGQWIASAVDAGEKKRKLASALGWVIEEIGPVPSKIGLIVSKNKIVGRGGVDPFVALASLARYTKGIFQRENPKGWATIPAFPWKVKDSGGKERTVTAEMAAQALWTPKERSLGIWPYLEAPLLTFVSQATGDTPECNGPDARKMDRGGRRYYQLALGDLFFDLPQVIESDGQINPGLAANMGMLQFKNQYTGKAQGSQVGVVNPLLPCTSFVTLDVPMLQKWDVVKVGT